MLKLLFKNLILKKILILVKGVIIFKEVFELESAVAKVLLRK